MTSGENIRDGVIANVLSAVIIGIALALALPWIAARVSAALPALPWGK